MYAQDTVKVKTSLTPEQESQNLYNQGLELITKKEYNLAIENFSKAISLNPNFKKAYYNRGFAKFDSKNYSGAIEDYNKTLSLNPKNLDALYGKAQSFYSTGKKDSCRIVVAKLLAENSKFEKGFYLSGQLKFEEQSYKEAIEDYDKAILLKSDYAYAYNDRASAKKMLGDDAGAIVDYEKAIAIDSKMFFAYNNLGSCKRNKGDNAGAIAAYTKAIELKSDYYVALNNRGTAKMNNGDLAGAISDFDEALKYNKEYTMAMNNIATAYIKKKDFVSAIEWATKAIKNDSKCGVAYLNRGIAKQMNNDESGACADWKMAADNGVTEGKSFSSGLCD